MKRILVLFTFLLPDILSIQTTEMNTTYCLRKDQIGKKFRLNNAFRMKREYNELQVIKAKLKENNELNILIKKSEINLRKIQKLLNNTNQIISDIEESKRSDSYIHKSKIEKKEILRIKNEIFRLRREKTGILGDFKRYICLKIENTEKIIFYSNYFIRNENFISKFGNQDMSFIETLRNKQKYFISEFENDSKTLNFIVTELENQNFIKNENLNQIKSSEKNKESCDEIEKNNFIERDTGNNIECCDEIEKKDIFISRDTGKNKESCDEIEKKDIINHDIPNKNMKNTQDSSGIEVSSEGNNFISEENNISSYSQPEIQYFCSTPKKNTKNFDNFILKNNFLNPKSSSIHKKTSPQHTETFSDDISFSYLNPSDSICYRNNSEDDSYGSRCYEETIVDYPFPLTNRRNIA
ncbi:hypothetical protein CWI38_1565p0020 [Hamiltosporidium tvaerminnensis]|uniref:Uncharacterized protein n=1 Tax=Hamiltosporidium tvaerminnensis TaxID=1176355 RepID=A0A4Q9LR72_9MICR|nr:hypothetical protein CWI38_1565p0020 [Hamiltosporidium tvaerminnensis]